MRISDWSSDVCSSDLHRRLGTIVLQDAFQARAVVAGIAAHLAVGGHVDHHHAKRPVAAGLQGEHAVVLVEAGEAAAERRSAERSVGQQCVSTCRSRGSTSHSKKKNNIVTTTNTNTTQ